MQLFIKPADSFYFRGHNDFTPGENSAAATIFPPRPGTIYGSLRSGYIHSFNTFEEFAAGNAETTVHKWMGTPEKTGDFQIKGSFIADKGKPLFSLPLDYQVVKQNNELASFPLKLMETEPQSSDGERHRLMASVDGKSESSEGKLITEDSLKKIILGMNKGIPVYGADKWLESEHKLGIARNNKTKTTTESMLYNITKMRFKNSDTTFFVLADQESTPSFEEVPFLKVGGGNRPSALEEKKEMYQILSDQEKQTLIEGIQKSRKAKLILLTPTIWNKGSRPGSYNADQNNIEISENLKVEIITAAIGRPTLIGGWDIQKRRPKPRMNAVPAGSVLYVRVDPEEAKSFVEETMFKNYTDQLAHEGYGLMVPALIHN